MLNDISIMLGIVGVTFGVATWLNRPDLGEIKTSLKEIAQLLRETREDYVTKEDCNRHRDLLMYETKKQGQIE